MPPPAPLRRQADLVLQAEAPRGSVRRSPVTVQDSSLPRGRWKRCASVAKQAAKQAVKQVSSKLTQRSYRLP